MRWITYLEGYIHLLLKTSNKIFQPEALENVPAWQLVHIDESVAPAQLEVETSLLENKTSFHQIEKSVKSLEVSTFEFVLTEYKN